MPERRPLLLDVDTGVDDAIAIALASNLPTHEIVAITTVAGNVSVEKATVNTLKVCEWLDQSHPVYRGMSAPMSRLPHYAEEFHGVDGLGGWDLPLARRDPERLTAPEVIIQTAYRHQKEIDFAFVGPLTNLAVALKLEPRLPTWVRRLVIMGGAFYEPGNVSEHAEFNIYADPEAAVTVALSSFDTTWIGLDVTTKTVLTKSAWAQTSATAQKSAMLVHHVCKHAFIHRKRSEFHLHDPLAVAVVADDSMISGVSGDVYVSTGHENRGLTRVNSESRAQSSHAVASNVDSEKFYDLFSSLLDIPLVDSI